MVGQGCCEGGVIPGDKDVGVAQVQGWLGMGVGQDRSVGQVWMGAGLLI